ncbi:MAG: DUF4440 domain-containing protein, partial [Aquabacterium sp.]|uniref:nuclear transport factor 2 family protein n=1 Tax=Aquabacterium sp. TaxID=1872578 RepID=UPI001203828C
MADLLETLIQLERTLHHPGAALSAAQCDDLLHADFFEVGKSGLRYSRQQVLAYLSQVPAAAASVVDSSDYRVHELGPDCALLTYACIHESEGCAVKVWRSSIWRQTASGWQLFYHQGTVA